VKALVNDSWTNGLLLSEILSSLPTNDKNNFKSVESRDQVIIIIIVIIITILLLLLLLLL
jgi:hypothetical protein